MGEVIRKNCGFDRAKHRVYGSLELNVWQQPGLRGEVSAKVDSTECGRGLGST